MDTVRSAPVPWSGRIRAPDSLDLSRDRGERFQVWKESWDDYVLLTGLDHAAPNIQLAALKNVMTAESRRVLRNLDITESDRTDPDAVLAAIERFAVGQVNEVIERKRFNERVQSEGEPFDDYLTSLRELSRSCKFCANCNDSLIRDRVVMGLRSAETIKSLLAIPDLSLAQAITVCRAQEAATRDAQELRSSVPAQASAFQLRGRERSRDQSSPHCTACGRWRHQREQQCPARGQRCRTCQQLNHFSVVCRHRTGIRTGGSNSSGRRTPSPRRAWYQSSPPGRYQSSPPGRYQSPARTRYQSPGRARYQSPPPDQYRPPGHQVHFQSPEGGRDSRYTRRPNASAIIASTSVESAPRVALVVEAHLTATVEALPDTGADISVAGTTLLDKLGEYPENLLPAEQHPRAANGETITSIGILPVSLTLGETTMEERIHILPDVSALLLSWRAARKLRIIPQRYPEQISHNSSENASVLLPSLRTRTGTPAESAPSIRDGGTAAPPIVHATHVPPACATRPTSIGSIKNPPPANTPGAAARRPSGPDQGSLPPETEVAPPIPAPAAPPGFPDVTREFPTVFDGRIRAMPGEEFEIHIRDDAVPFCATTPRRVPLSLREPLREELEKLQSENIITPVTTPTEWCAPIVVAPKKGGNGVRLCVDLSHLNKYVRRETYQSPTPAEEVASITTSQAGWFTVFDALKGYHQCTLKKQSQLLTTFTTPFGRYAYLRAPYGVTSISEHYNRRLDEAFEGLNGYRKVVDDVIIFSRTLEDHILDVRAFLTRCQEKGISLNLAKLQLAQRSVRFAGFIVSQDGYHPDPQLTRAISEFPTPHNITDLRSFFGLVNQVASFMEEVSELLSALRPLLSSKNEFRWEEEHQRAFEAAKTALTSVPALAFFDPSRPTSLSTDASRLQGLGFVLSQAQRDGTWRVIQAGSRFLTPAETRYATIELEATAVAWAIKKCRLFLSGLPTYQVITDHKPLIPIINSKTLDEIENPRLQRLKMKMGEVGSFTAVWVPGSQHKAADALSRNPTQDAETGDECGEDPASPSLCTIATAELQAHQTDLHLDEVRRAVESDPEAQLLIEVIGKGFPNQKSDVVEPLKKYWPVHERLSVDSGIILCGCRVVVPSSLRRTTLTSLHAGHLGKERTKSRARQVVYWPGMDTDIENTVKQCERCQSELPTQQRETLTEHELASRPFQFLDMDFADHAGGKYLIVVDGYSGWRFIDCVGPRANTDSVIRAMLGIFCQVGIPEVVWTDGGTQFTSHQFQAFLKKWGIKHCTSSPHYHQSNGRAESGVKAAKRLLRRCWDFHRGKLDEEEWTRGILQHRNTPGSSGRSPAEIVYGRSLRDSLPAHSLSYHRAESCHINEEACRRQRQQVRERYDVRARDLPAFAVGTRVRVQDARTRRWDRCGVVTLVCPYRRYRIRYDDGGEVERNRCHLRVHNGTPGAGLSSGTFSGTPFPAGDDVPLTLRRSARVRRPPRRLIEEM